MGLQMNRIRLTFPVLGNTPLARGPCAGTGSEGAPQPTRNACDSGGNGRARGRPGNGCPCQGVQARAPKVLQNKDSPREVVGVLEVVEDVTGSGELRVDRQLMALAVAQLWLGTRQVPI